MKKAKLLIKVLFLNLVVFVGILFTVFLVLDRFPTLLDLNCWYFPNLAIRHDYEMDSELIFRARPTHKVFYTYGGSYNTGYERLGVHIDKYRAEMTIHASGFPDEPRRGGYEIMALGDSFFQVASNDSDSFPRYLEKASGASTVSMGLAWYGPFQYLEVFRRFGPVSGARIAVLGFSESSDMADESEYLKWKAGGDYYDNEFRYHPDTGMLTRFSYFIDDLTGFASKIAPVTTKLPREKLAAELIELNLKGKLVKARFAHSPERRTPDEILAAVDGIALKQVMTEFTTLAESKGVFPVLVFLPSFEHIYGPLTTDGSGEKWKQVRAESLEHRSNIEETVKRIAQSAKLELIDLVPAFEKKAAEGKLLYPPFDAHWNPEGRWLAAREVTARLRSLGKLTSSPPVTPEAR